MLENTFIHIPSIGENKEKKLWEYGIRTWEDYLTRFGELQHHATPCKIIKESIEAVSKKNGEFFGRMLPNNQAWRAVKKFDKICYVDIETTGLGRGDDYTTVIGLYDGERVKSYIHGKNINEFLEEVSKYETIVTFNGTLFDLPFIKREFANVKLPAIHVDLRFVLASLEIKGGLKKIEEKFGLEREDDLKGLNGYDAVLLWKKYKKDNDEAALDKLVRYNAADIQNLKFLLNYAYDEKSKRLGFS